MVDWTDSSDQNKPIRLNAQHQSAASDPAETIRESVLRAIEAQRTLLEQVKASISRTQMDNEGNEALEWVEQRLAFLDGMEAAAHIAPLPALLSLSLSMPGQIAATHSVLSAAKTEAAHQIGHSIGERTKEAYVHYSHALRDRVRGTDAANARHFNSAMGTLDRHGAGEHFRRAQSELEAEREAAEKNGEHGKARVADALIAHNTLNALDKAIELEESPDKREQLESERKRQLDLVAEREAAMRKQLMLDGAKDAKERGLTGKEAEEHARKYQEKELETYRQRRDKMRDAASIQGDPARQQDGLQEIDAKAATKDAEVQADLASKSDLHTQARADQRDGKPAPTATTSVAHAFTDKKEAAVGRSNDRASNQDGISDTFGATAKPDPLKEAKAQFDAQQPNRPDIKHDKVAAAEAEGKTPASTPATAPSAEAKARG
jgi:hypothetical protein